MAQPTFLELVTPAGEPTDDEGKTGSVLKALQVLDVFRTHGPTMGVSEIARRAGLAKSTAFRLLSNFEQAGFIERVGTNYQLGWRLFELGNRVEQCQPQGIRGIAAPYLGELFSRTQFAVHLAVLDGNDVLYLDKVSGPQSPRTPSKVGGRVQASCTSLGKAILAFSEPAIIQAVVESGLQARTRYSVTNRGRFLQQLRRVRAEGVAYEREESALGLICAGAPILVNGLAFAAVSVSGPTGRFDPAQIGNHVRRTAARISRDAAADLVSG